MALTPIDLRIELVKTGVRQSEVVKWLRELAPADTRERWKLLDDTKLSRYLNEHVAMPEGLPEDFMGAVDAILRLKLEEAQAKVGATAA